MTLLQGEKHGATQYACHCDIGSQTLKLSVLAVGHRMPAWIASGFDEYARRMPREMPLALIELKPEPRNEAPGSNAATRVLEREAQRIEAAVPKGANKVVLDETGKAVSTRQLAQRMGMRFEIC